MLRRLLALCLIAAAPAALAQPQRDDLARTEQDKQLREQQRDAAVRDAVAARREIDDLSSELSQLTGAQAAGITSVSEARIRLETLNAREAELAARMGANQSELARLLSALQTFSREPPPALFVHPNDAKRAVRAAILVRAVTPELKRRADGYATQATDLRNVRREAAAAAGDLFTAESDLADRASRMETLITERQALETALITDISRADQEIASLDAKAVALRQVVARLPPGPITKAPTTALTRLSPPVSGPPVRRFGQAAPGGGRSEGWAWRPVSGANVAAPAAGVVEFAGPVNGWKTVLILRLSDNYHLVLAGLDAVTAKPGQTVAPGQAVATMANRTGLGLGSEIPELTLELRRDGQSIDPARFLPQ